MLVAGLIGALALVSPSGTAAAPPVPPDQVALHRPLHLPKLRRGARCPVSPGGTATAAPGQTLNGRGPVFMVGRAPATIDFDFSSPDRLGWYAQKTPWLVSRSYDGPLLVRGARIDRRGAVRFARGFGDHLRELYWDAAVDQGLPPDPDYRFLASATLVRSRGCYAFQVDGTSFSKVIVMRVRG